MQLKFTYKVLPYILRYTDNMPEQVGGRARYILVEIRPKYKDDKGIHAHEAEHVKQCYRWLFIPFRLLYHFSESFRFRAEVDAYAVQIKQYPREVWDKKVNTFAAFLFTRYRLKRTLAQCLVALKMKRI